MPSLHLTPAKLLASLVFFFLDLLDALLCVLFRFVDRVVDGAASECYCSDDGCGSEEVSESLYGRKNAFRKLVVRKLEKTESKFDDAKMAKSRWSDCGCQSCLSWMRNGGDLKLHVSAFQPSNVQECERKPAEMENVIFLHGFLASSSFWTETIVPNFSHGVKANYRLFAVDLLGFGKSPKPRDCLYTLRDHLEMVKKSVVEAYALEVFHVVAHSMGCVVALALAAEFADSVKSVTLVAPPYFPSAEDAGLTALEKLAEKKLWPPMAFGSAVMSWYEHVGRCVCFFFCRFHLVWESILKFLARKRYSITLFFCFQLLLVNAL
uniref:AB hydrolase-1 domain-containing protein n=1 Tax=Kalanchoe fedtschenkoi TaxID=63787 RepID=A0A7N0T9F9_KALFE